eukprot:Clim_evm46s146 gene=Clim_evmTU46s146
MGACSAGTSRYFTIAFGAMLWASSLLMLGIGINSYLSLQDYSFWLQGDYLLSSILLLSCVAFIFVLGIVVVVFAVQRRTKPLLYTGYLLPVFSLAFIGMSIAGFNTYSKICGDFAGSFEDCIDTHIDCNTGGGVPESECEECLNELNDIQTRYDCCGKNVANEYLGGGNTNIPASCYPGEDPTEAPFQGGCEDPTCSDLEKYQLDNALVLLCIGLGMGAMSCIVIVTAKAQDDWEYEVETRESTANLKSSRSSLKSPRSSKV